MVSTVNEWFQLPHEKSSEIPPWNFGNLKSSARALMRSFNPVYRANMVAIANHSTWTTMVPLALFNQKKTCEQYSVRWPKALPQKTQRRVSEWSWWPTAIPRTGSCPFLGTHGVRSLQQDTSWLWRTPANTTGSQVDARACITFSRVLAVHYTPNCPWWWLRQGPAHAPPIPWTSQGWRR